MKNNKLQKIGPSTDWVNNTWLYSSTEKYDMVIFENDNDDYEVLRVEYDTENETRDEDQLYSSTSIRDAINFCIKYYR